MATAVEFLERCYVVPPGHAPTEHTLPLLHFDMIFLHSKPLKHLLFFDIPCSKSHFLESIVPKLKASVATTLTHFLPLTGNIHFPLTPSGRPISSYGKGDSVLLTVAQSSSDFSNLTSNLSRKADQFYDLTPELPEPDCSTEDFIKIPVTAFQVTLFPDKGICIGVTSHHAIADGNTLMVFLQTWASVSKYDGDAHLLASREKYLPSYDRSSVEDSNGLDSVRWNQMKRVSNPGMSYSTIAVPLNNVTATFIISGADIEKLKNSATDGYFSSFIVVCAHVWSCLAKLAGEEEEVLDDDEIEYLTAIADCRARLNPPLPLNYFGNCLASIVAGLSHKKLKGSDGFLNAAHAITDAIGNTVRSNDKGILDGSENRIMGFKKLAGKRVLRVAGSPRFDPYSADYGWGRPKKLEALPTDNHNGRISLCKSREFQGVEVSLLMTQSKMDSFAAIFNKGLRGELA